MSKTTTAWDALGEAMLPSDFDTPTEGSNYGLDGYPDLDYGAGVLDGNVFGEPRLETNLPDGVVLEPDTDHLASEFGETGTDMGDISSFMKEAGLTDLSWLELADQDPDRLPKNPVNLSIPELEEAWGKNRRTNGVQVTVPNVDRKAAIYEASLTRGDEAPTAEKKAQVADMVRLASRQVASGVDFGKVARAVEARLGHDAPLAKSAMMALKDDAGLLGRVFIRASHYPACANGKWSESVRKHAAEATYIVSKKACGGCVHAQGGNCAVFKKQLVAQVPWERAAKNLTPMLEATGRRVASSGDVRANLKAALALEPRGMSRVGDTRPVMAAPADTITTREAKAAFEAMPVVAPTRIEAVTAEKRIAGIEARVAAVRKNVDNGLVGRRLVAHVMRMFPEADRGLALDMLDPFFREKRALEEPTAKHAYTGVHNDMHVAVPNITAEDAWSRLRGASVPSPVDISHREIALRVRKEAAVRAQMTRTLDRWASEGLLASDMHAKLTASEAPPREVLRIAMGLMSARGYTPLGTRTGQVAVESVTQEEATRQLLAAEADLQRREASIREAAADADIRDRVAHIEAEIQRGVRGSILRSFIRRTIRSSEAVRASKYLGPILRRTGALADAPVVAHTYEGVAFEAHQPRKASDEATTPEVNRLVKWARIQMSEGFAGRDLDELISHRFGGATRKAASVALHAVRAAHEGLAGHVYVDASAYASAAGTTGCEAGGLKHRANAVPTVLQMDRCGSCAQRAVRKNGSSVCRVYNKTLVASAGDAIEGGDAMAYQRETIKLANATDVEHTSSMFAPAYDAGEFGLSHPAEFEDIPLDDEVGFEPLDGIAFGGMNWE